MSYRGNRLKVEADATRIAERFRTGESMASLRREYHTCYDVMRRTLEAVLGEDEYAEYCRRNIAASGKASRFKKGHSTWNKGRKGIRMSPATEFKPGGIRGAAARKYKAVGTITIRRDKPPKRLRNRKRKNGMPWPSNKRRWIKVSDNGRPQDRWMPYARWLWLRTNGEIPDGKLVIHVDGDTMNDSPANLKLVGRRTHLAILMTRDPSILVRRGRAWSKATKKRHATARLIRAVRPVEKVKMIVCAACGWMADETQPERCPKCGGYSFETVNNQLAVAGCSLTTDY